MNCCADIGVPSGCQKVVIIMCWMVRSLPSASFTFTFRFFSQTHGPGRRPGTALSDIRRATCRRSAHGLGGGTSQTQGYWPHFGHGFRFQRFAVPFRIAEMLVRLHEVVDREVVLAVVEPRAAPDDLLELDHRVDRRISTMLRMLRASTPVESFCEVVRIVGMVFSLS